MRYQGSQAHLQCLGQGVTLPACNMCSHVVIGDRTSTKTNTAQTLHHTILATHQPCVASCQRLTHTTPHHLTCSSVALSATLRSMQVALRASSNHHASTLLLLPPHPPPLTTADTDKRTTEEVTATNVHPLLPQPPPRLLSIKLSLYTAHTNPSCCTPTVAPTPRPSW